MVINMKKILEDMGWSDGFYIPVANNENLQLEAEIERLTATKVKLTFTHEALEQKCVALDKHLKNVTNEQEENQNILFGIQSQLDAEKNLYLAAKKEKDILLSEIKSINKEYEKVDARKQTKYKDLNAVVEKLDKAKASVEWDEEAINNWEELLMKKSEDNDLILKYAKEDRLRAKELEVKRLHLQEEEHNRRQLVIRTSKELDTLELILTRNVQQYKQMHNERNVLLKQWQTAVKHLQQRDADTLAINREIINVRELNEVKLGVLEEEKQFYENELNNNKELESQIEYLNMEVSALRKDIQNNDATVRAYNVELHARKRELQKTDELLQKERVVVKKLNKDLVDKNKLLTDLINKVNALKEQEKTVSETNVSSSQRCKALEEIIRTEEINESALFADIEAMQNTIFRSQEMLNELLEYNKVKTVQLRGAEQGIQILEREREQIEKQLVVQKEQNYKVNYRMALLNSKLTRLLGSDNLEDTAEERANEDKLAELEVKCNEVVQLSSMLQMEQLRIEDFMRQLTNAITADTEKITNMKNTLQNQKLLVEGAVKRVAENKNLEQQHQVDENVLKVRLNHAERSLKNEGSHIYNLQRQQLELETMMKERETEIHITKEMLVAKRNALDVDNSKLRVDIQGSRLKTETLKKKLDTILSTIGKSEDGETINAAYFKIKQGQEKSILQEEGDKLDTQIRQAEKEIIAMENTLKAVNQCNDSFKKSLTVLTEEDEELEEMAAAEKELYDTTKLVRHLRAEFIQQQEKVIKVEEDLETFKVKIEDLKKVIAENEENLALLENEAMHRREKITRAEKCTRKVTDKHVFDEENVHDFIAHELQDANKNAIQQLTEISSKYIETKPKIVHYLSEHNMALVPSSSSSKSSSRSCSSLSYSSSTSELFVPKINLG